MRWCWSSENLALDPKVATSLVIGFVSYRELHNYLHSAYIVMGYSPSSGRELLTYVVITLGPYLITS
jgi:hypothetical protein